MSSSLPNYTVLDAETTTHNKGHPFDPRNKLISYTFRRSDLATCRFLYYTDPDFAGGRSEVFGTVVGFSIKFDCHWLYPTGLENPIWDCQLAEHVYTGQKAQFISLNECLERYGLKTKKDLVKEMWDAGYQTDEIPLPILQEYNEWDVIQTEKLFLIQQELLSDEQKRLVYLMGEDLKVLQHIEAAGFRFDCDAARLYVESSTKELQELEGHLSERLPLILHGTFNWDSGDHLSCFLYGGTLDFDYFTSVQAVYKSGPKKGEEYTKNSWFVERVLFKQLFKPLEGTELKKTKDKVGDIIRLYQTDAPTLQSLKGRKQDKQLLDLLAKRSEIKKVVEMSESILKLFETKQWENNLVHGQYNQNVAITGRLSSSSPNMQNTPPEIDQFFISRYAD